MQGTFYEYCYSAIYDKGQTIFAQVKLSEETLIH